MKAIFLPILLMLCFSAHATSQTVICRLDETLYNQMINTAKTRSLTREISLGQSWRTKIRIQGKWFKTEIVLYENEWTRVKIQDSNNKTIYSSNHHIQSNGQFDRLFDTYIKHSNSSASVSCWRLRTTSNPENKNDENFDE